MKSVYPGTAVACVEATTQIMADDEHLRTLFTTFDRDGSGTLDAEELVAILTRMDL